MFYHLKLPKNGLRFVKNAKNGKGYNEKIDTFSRAILNKIFKTASAFGLGWLAGSEVELVLEGLKG